jgi:hypothetical protein
VHDDRPFVGVDDADLKEVPGVVGSDEHDEALLEVFDADGIVERVDDGLVSHRACGRGMR